LASIPHSEMNGIVLDDTFNADHCGAGRCMNS
jgi:hypothetical protein